jgi:tRNA(Ile)-lysidine synthase
MDPVRRLRAKVGRALEQPLVARAGERWLVACSGGPDSTALLDTLVVVSGRALHVASVDHGLRSESAGEAEAVVRSAQQRGLPAAVLRLTVEGRSMAAARRARYEALVSEAKRVGASAIAVGHTASDQAETLLHRLIRGAGTRGLSGMAKARRLDDALVLIRPLLEVTRAEVEAYLAARGLSVVHDPTNVDGRYLRSRIRYDVVPLLRRERPDIEAALAELCDRLRADADALDEAAAEAGARIVASDGTLDAAALAALPEALFARLMARAAGLTLGAVHVAALRRLCTDRRGTHSLDLPARLTAERRYDRLRFFARGDESAPEVTEEVAVVRPGIYLFSGMQVDVDARLWQALGSEPLTLRPVRPGDRLRGRKLQDLLVDHKVPRPERARLPVLARGGCVLWIGLSAIMQGDKRGPIASVP